MSDKILDLVKPGNVVLIVTGEGSYFRKISGVLKFLTKTKGKQGVYVSMSKPYSKVSKNLKGVDLDNLLFLDGISSRLQEKSSLHDNCINLQGPTSLTEASIFITKATIKGNVDFIIVDSISGILRYNNEKITMRFVEYVISKIKSVNTIGIFAIDGSDFNKPIVKVIKDLADGVVK
jgi:hypothetical protein